MHGRHAFLSLSSFLGQDDARFTREIHKVKVRFTYAADTSVDDLPVISPRRHRERCFYSDSAPWNALARPPRNKPKPTVPIPPCLSSHLQPRNADLLIFSGLPFIQTMLPRARLRAGRVHPEAIRMAKERKNPAKKNPAKNRTSLRIRDRIPTIRRRWNDSRQRLRYYNLRRLFIFLLVVVSYLRRRRRSNLGFATLASGKGRV